MPEVLMVSITRDWEKINRDSGTTIITKATGRAGARAGDASRASICDIAWGMVFIGSL